MTLPWGFDNGAQNTAPSAITSGQTTLPLSSSAAFAKLATSNYRAILMIQDTGPGGVGPSKYEFVAATGNNTGTNTITGLTRGQGGTSAQSFVAGATVTQVCEASQLQDFSQISTTVEQIHLGQITAPTFKTSGAGSPFTAAARCVGVLNTTGLPTSGTWLTNDYGWEANGIPIFCTSGGTPGTWRDTGEVHLASLSAFTTGQTVTIPSGIQNVRGKVLVTNNTVANVLIQFNADSANNYTWQEDGGTGASASASTAATTNGMRVGVNNNASSLATEVEFWIPKVASGLKKMLKALQTRVDTTSALITAQNSGFWNSTAAITSITITLQSGAFVSGSSFIDVWGSL